MFLLSNCSVPSQAKHVGEMQQPGRHMDPCGWRGGIRGGRANFWPGRLLRGCGSGGQMASSGEKGKRRPEGPLPRFGHPHPSHKQPDIQALAMIEPGLFTSVALYTSMHMHCKITNMLLFFLTRHL